MTVSGSQEHARARKSTHARASTHTNDSAQSNKQQRTRAQSNEQAMTRIRKLAIAQPSARNQSIARAVARPYAHARKRTKQPTRMRADKCAQTRTRAAPAAWCVCLSAVSRRSLSNIRGCRSYGLIAVELVDRCLALSAEYRDPGAVPALISSSAIQTSSLDFQSCCSSRRTRR